MSKNLIFFADGGSRGNPGPSACGFVIYELSSSNFTDLNNSNLDKYKPSFELIKEKGQFLGIKTNNQAEWQGLILGLKTILEIFPKEKVNLKVFLDSQLVVRQAIGQYKVKNPGLQELFMEFKKLIKHFENCKIEHIYREQNQEADKVVNQILDNN